MKTYKEVHIPSAKRKELEKIICDLCGSEGHPFRDSWNGNVYEIDKAKVYTCVEYEKGSSYPEGGEKTTVYVDICPNCFKQKLIPWLKSQGANIQERESDW